VSGDGVGAGEMVRLKFHGGWGAGTEECTR
jgi:hypothetical protein